MYSFVLQIQEIDEGRATERVFPITPEWLAEALADTEVDGALDRTPGRLSVLAQRDGVELLVQARVEAALRVPCARCLEDVPVAVDVQATALFAPEATRRVPVEGEDIQLSAEDLDRDYYTHDTLVLDAFVREQLLLEVPMQPLCSSDCAGLEIPAHLRPPELGEGDEVDPRLAPLRALGATIRK
ncbi:MAG: DUF177 domain-containing protein [Myxococcales bacterium]|nr:DUF177 domain-containing protein [Myxococcales bacterium]